ncbi:hypothetical protein [Marinobacter sp. V034]|uniref:hypothetical protein n=1 Tax=Marinobacter sp. V034 TaxID=3459610 RepID=UPI004044CC52
MKNTRLKLAILFLLTMGYGIQASAEWSQYTTSYFSQKSWQFDNWDQVKIEQWNTYHKNIATYAYYTLWIDMSLCTGNSICARYTVYRWVGGGEPAECPASATGCNENVPQPCVPPNLIHPETQQCIAPQEPEECVENGQFYEQAGYCVTVCSSGSALDSVCLENPQQECAKGASDYIGAIGFGGNQKSVCGDNSCPEGGTFGFKEQDDGSYTASCFPADSKPPQCNDGAALILGKQGYAFQCEGIVKEGPNPDSNGDSDGDGEGDTTGITNQLSDIKKLMEQGNTETTNIKNKLEGLTSAVKSGTDAITDAIGKIPGGGGGNGDGDGEGETEDPITWSGEPIDTELTDPTEQYDQVMADYQAKINEIKGDVQAMFSTNLTGGGSVDDNTKTIMGVEINFSLNRFLPGLDILGAIVLFCAAFISAGILFSGRG